MRLDPVLAGRLLIVICSLLIVFHAANFLGIVPVNITWLGKLDSNESIKIMSLVSIAINLAIVFCAAIKCKYIKNTFLDSIVEKSLPFVFWWLVGNSIANLFAKSKFEVVVFTPILVILTVCVYVLKSTGNTESKAV